MLHTLPPSLISMHSKLLLHFEKYKKKHGSASNFLQLFPKSEQWGKISTFLQILVSRHIRQFWENMHFIHPLLSSQPPFFLIPLLCIVLCIMYFTCKDAPIMYARHSLYADQVSLGSSWASQANAWKQTIICQNERKMIHYQYHCHICCYFRFASNMMEQILMLVFLLTMQWSSLSGKCWQNAVALWILIEIYALWILIVIFLSLCNWE